MKGTKNPDDFFASQELFRQELVELRSILNDTLLEETIKWGIPVYTLNEENVVGISAFKSYFGLWFYQGALLSDPSKVLINAQEGVTKAMRQYRLNSANDIDKQTILQLVNESIEHFKNGNKIKPQTKPKTSIPKELMIQFEQNSAMKESFNALAPYKQREYIEYITSAKQETTKINRLNKILPLIELGMGLHDKFR